MDLQNIAVQMVMEKLGGADEGVVGTALGSLLGDSGSDLNVGGLVEKFAGGSLGGALASWLGDGDNDVVSTSQITDALGAGKVAEFASNLGVGEDEAASALSSVLPQLIDKSSSGGDLLGNVAGLASKLFN